MDLIADSSLEEITKGEQFEKLSARWTFSIRVISASLADWPRNACQSSINKLTSFNEKRLNANNNRSCENSNRNARRKKDEIIRNSKTESKVMDKERAVVISQHVMPTRNAHMI
jgi:hypothetical protein